MKKIVSILLVCFTMIALTGCEMNNQDKKSELNPIELVNVDIKPGTVIGQNNNGIYSFKGIPYATAKRFHSPKPIKKYENGLQNALTYGTVAPQDRTSNGNGKVNDFEFMTPSNGTADMVANENCQNLNVWTKNLDDKKPVIVFFHGGGLMNGASSELSTYDGKYFVEKQDAVFVSVNHRLNVLGFLDVSEYGEQYKDSAIAGIQDCVVALQWVQDNIEKFGGDPSNVTILGQSGGGMKVTTLACMSDTVGLFDKVFVMSGLYSTSTKEDGLENTRLLVNYLNVPESKLMDTLNNMSYEELLHATTEAGCQWNTAAGNGTYEKPLIDPDTGKINEYAAQRKWIWGTTYSEFTSNATELIATGNKELAINNTDDEKLKNLVSETYPVKTKELMEEFKKAYPNKNYAELLCLSNTPGMIDRGSDIDQENGILKAFNDSDVEVYNYLVTYTFPFFDGVTMYHTGDIPFWFNSLDEVNYLIVGDDENANKLSQQMSSSLAAFIKTGNPSTKELDWKPYTSKEHHTMVFDINSELKTDFDTKLYSLIKENNEALSQN